MTFKPLLAVTIDDLETLSFPVWASAKLDGYRCLCLNGQAVSRNLKPIRNNYVRQQLEAHMDVLNGFDGELCLSDLTAKFNDVSSAISRADGEPKFRYVIFDYHDSTEPYSDRFLANLSYDFPDFVIVVPMKRVTSLEELIKLHHQYTALGFEGTMVRRADGKDRYKFGRSTLNEAYLLKIKDFADTEAVVIGFEERLSNQNEATKNLLGHTERSHHLENMVPMNTLGALIVSCHDFELNFAIGTGFTDAERKLIWDNKADYLHQRVKFRHQPSGAKSGGKPRFPSFSGFRDSGDMDG